MLCSHAQPDWTPGQLTNVNCLLQTHRAQSELEASPLSSIMPSSLCPEQMVPCPQTYAQYRPCVLRASSSKNCGLWSPWAAWEWASGTRIPSNSPGTRTSSGKGSNFQNFCQAWKHSPDCTHTLPNPELQVITAPAALNSPSHIHPLFTQYIPGAGRTLWKYFLVSVI